MSVFVGSSLMFVGCFMIDVRRPPHDSHGRWISMPAVAGSAAAQGGLPAAGRALPGVCAGEARHDGAVCDLMGLYDCAVLCR